MHNMHVQRKYAHIRICWCMYPPPHMTCMYPPPHMRIYAYAVAAGALPPRWVR
jgi:hypothetical protein